MIQEQCKEANQVYLRLCITMPLLDQEDLNYLVLKDRPNSQKEKVKNQVMTPNS